MGGDREREIEYQFTGKKREKGRENERGRERGRETGREGGIKCSSSILIYNLSV
jgi:hypothetical protein